MQIGTLDNIIVLEANEGVEMKDSSLPKDVKRTPKIKKMCLTETKKKNVNNISASIIKRKNQKQVNEDAITKNKLEILEIQRQQELLKLEKTKVMFDLDIELKKVLLEDAKLDLELKKADFNSSLIIN